MMVQSISPRRPGGTAWLEPQAPLVWVKLDYVDRIAGRRLEDFGAATETDARADALMFVRDYGVPGLPFKIELKL